MVGLGVRVGRVVALVLLPRLDCAVRDVEIEDAVVVEVVDDLTSGR
ncbi:MAG: hypothetical protein AAFZ87_11055 [Planctomycetota bacterium]